MGKGVVTDSHPLNVSSARSAALKHADVVLVLGARLNWILHFGEPPKWSPRAKIIQVDVCAEEIGRNAGNAELGILGDVDQVVGQLLSTLGSWRYSVADSEFSRVLGESARKNEAKAGKAALAPTSSFLTYQRAYHIIKTTLDSQSAPADGDIVYVSEGANAMDVSRSVFPLHHPRQRLDAGTYATMGVGMGYIIAAHEAFNNNNKPAKKIVALEGDSAFGFSAMEVETMARYRIPALIFVMNNSGIYHGDASSETAWKTLQEKGLRSTSLLYETRYELLATMCGGKGYFVRSEEELETATREGFQNDVVTIVNVVVEPGVGKKIEFGWQKSNETSKEAKL